MNSAPVGTNNDRELRRARALARLLDSAVGVPGTPIRIGLDAVLGVIPGAGDFAGAALSGYIILTAARRGVPREVLWRMLANVAIDTGIGTIPLLGDLFDVAWRSNMRNVDLLERHTTNPREVASSSRRAGILVIAVLVLLLIGFVTIGVLVTRAIWQLVTG